MLNGLRQRRGVDCILPDGCRQAAGGYRHEVSEYYGRGLCRLDCLAQLETQEISVVRTGTGCWVRRGVVTIGVDYGRRGAERVHRQTVMDCRSGMRKLMQLQ